MVREQNATLTNGHRKIVRNIVEKEGANKRNHKGNIRNRIKESIYDLQLLFSEYEQEELELTFEEGANPTDGPLDYDIRPRASGFSDTGYGDIAGFPREGNKNKGYPEGSAVDATVARITGKAEKHDKQLLREQSKTSPQLQEALIDSIALFCRIAEAGQLNPRDLIEKGVERYYHEHNQETDQLVDLETASEQNWKQQIESNFETVKAWEEEGINPSDKPDLHDIPISKKTQLRYLKREGILPNSD